MIGYQCYDHGGGWWHLPDGGVYGAVLGFAYSFPPDITWTDTGGSIHQDSRPSCVRYFHAVRIRRTEAVIYPVGSGGYMGTVVWVRC